MAGHIPDTQLIALLFSPRISVITETLVCSFTVIDIAINIVPFTGQTSLLLFCFKEIILRKYSIQALVNYVAIIGATIDMEV